MRRQLESAWATLREWWKGERSPTEPMLCFLLSLHYAAYLTFLLLWLYRESTVSEVLEWRIFVHPGCSAARRLDTSLAAVYHSPLGRRRLAHLGSTPGSTTAPRRSDAPG